MNAAGAQDVKALLQQQNDQYRQLAAQHLELDSRLHQLLDKPYLSPSEQLEEVTIKKRKLALKDRMEAMAREYRQAHSSA